MKIMGDGWKEERNTVGRGHFLLPYKCTDVDIPVIYSFNFNDFIHTYKTQCSLNYSSLLALHSVCWILFGMC